MPNIVTGISLSALGAGTVTTAVTIPVSLASKSSARSEVKVTEPKAKVEALKPHSEWKGADDFHKYCYGDFLKEEAKGELLVCLDQSTEETKSSPIFYLRWKEQGTENFWQIKQITVGTAGGINWEIYFSLEGQTKSKKLTAKQSDHKDLNALHSNSLERLQNTCKDSKLSEENYQLKCVFKAGYATETYTNLAKKNWFEAR